MRKKKNIERLLKTTAIECINAGGNSMLEEVMKIIEKRCLKVMNNGSYTPNTSPLYTFY